jgi:hypothetical protein
VKPSFVAATRHPHGESGRDTARIIGITGAPLCYGERRPRPIGWPAIESALGLIRRVRLQPRQRRTGKPSHHSMD